MSDNYNMSHFSKFLISDPKKISPKTKTIILCLIMTPLILFCVNMSILTYKRGSKTVTDLTHVKGIINEERYIKQRHERTKYRQAYDEYILVFSIQGCDDEFGFTEKNKSYEDLANISFADNQTVADIYYDKSGQRIEDNVTLHIFDLKINEERYIKIEDIKKSELISTFIFSIISISLLTLTYIGTKRIK